MVLTDSKKGERMIIQSVSTIHPFVRRRLTDLGVVVNTEISCIQKMPFGGPYMIESNGQRIGIRRQDAGCIEVIRK